MEDKVRESLSNRDRREENFDEQLITSCRQFFSKRVEFRPASQPDRYLEDLRARYKPLNKVTLGMEEDGAAVDTAPPLPSSSGSRGDKGKYVDGLPHPKRILYDPELLEMKWKHPRSVGSGLANMGNTCFLNSVLQCLTYTPPLHHLLMSDNHRQMCRTQGFCAMCELERHSTRAFNTPSGVMRPVPIVQNLKAIAKHFRQGRQEDAHEFLRYFVDGLQKSCLQGCSPKLDPHSKATTAIHQIFGGYHRSQVKCLECLKTSDTFDPLLDLSLDIKNCLSLSKALQKSTKPDLLDEENKYACPFCKKMTRAQKKFTVHRLPRVLTIQLKRFEYSVMFGGKINKPVAYTEHVNMRPYMSEPQGPSEWYRLYSVLVHFGYSSHSGHYYCYIRNANGIWYCMNDSQVTQVSLATVLQQEAYLLFYIRDDEHRPPGQTPSSSASPIAKGSTQNLKVRPDPNFLGTPVVRRPGVDKSGTPLIKPLQKPTGVVTPSPQTVTHTHKVPTPNNGGRTHEFSIPLRKTGINSERKKQAAASVITPPGLAAELQKATPAPPTPTLHPTFKGPGFTPRVIAAGPKTRKLPKSTLFPKVITPSKVVDEQRSEVETSPARAERSKVRDEAAVDSSTRDESESGRVQTILDIAEMTLSGSSAASNDHTSTPTKEPTFIGPLLPSQFRSPPLSPAVQPFTLMSTATKSPKVARVQPQRHSPQQNVKPIARVLPSPQVPSSRERTTVQEEESLKGQDSKKERLKDGQESDGPSNYKTEERSQKERLVKDHDVGSSEKKAPSSDLATPSDHGPHVNSRLHWKVIGTSKPFGSALPDDYDTTAHGWTVTPVKSPSVERSHDGFKEKKKHKKKKYRKHSTEYDSESQGQSDVESSKKDKSFTEEQWEKENQGRLSEKNSQRRHDSDGSRKQEYRSGKQCLSPEITPHQVSRDNSGQARGRKEEHRKHRRHHSEYFDSREQREKRKHYSTDTEERHSRKRFPKKSKKRQHRSPSTSDSGGENHPRHREDYLSRRHVESKYSRHYHRHHLPGSRPWESRRGYSPDGHLDRSKRSMGHRRVERVRHSPTDGREKPYHHHKREHERRREKKDHDRPGHRRDSDREYERPTCRRNSHRDRSSSPDRERHKHTSKSHRDHSSSPDRERHKHTSKSHRDRSSSPDRERHKHATKSHRDHSSSPDRERDKHASKRLKAEAALSREEKRRSPVPEVEWDASVKRDGGGHIPPSHSQRWDGSQHSEIVERLTSHGNGNLGDIVMSWDGGKNAIDSHTMEGDTRRKRWRDAWDQELDQGKVKKVKTAKEDDHRSSCPENPFQEYQNRKNKLSHPEKSTHHHSA